MNKSIKLNYKSTKKKEEIVAENEDECVDFTFKNWCNNLNEETEAEFNDTDFFSNKSKKDCNIM